MPIGSRTAQASIKRRVAVEAFMRATHVDERRARALLSQARWKLGAAAYKFFRREEVRLQKEQPPDLSL